MSWAFRCFTRFLNSWLVVFLLMLAERSGPLNVSAATSNMPRYDDRDRGDRGYRSDDRGYRSEPSERFEHRGSDDGATRLYVGRLSSRTRSRDLEDLFAKYGRYEPILHLQMVGFLDTSKWTNCCHKFNFVECFSHIVPWATMCMSLQPTQQCFLSAWTGRFSCMISLDL